MPDQEFVTFRQWDSYASRIERRNLKERGTSLTRTGIASRAHGFIIDVQEDNGGMIVRKGWREAMKEASPGDSFASSHAIGG